MYVQYTMFVIANLLFTAACTIPIGLFILVYGLFAGFHPWMLVGVPFLIPWNVWAVFFTAPYDLNPRLQRLQTWLCWLDTFDAPTDAGWMDGYFGPDHYTADSPPSFWRRKLYQIMWLYRNPAYGFAYYPLGIPLDPKEWVVKYTPATADHAETFVARNEMDLAFFNYYRAPKLKLGWKVWNSWDSDTGTWKAKPFGPEWRAPLCFTPLFWIK